MCEWVTSWNASRQGCPSGVLGLIAVLPLSLTVYIRAREKGKIFSNFTSWAKQLSRDRAPALLLGNVKSKQNKKWLQLGFNCFMVFWVISAVLKLCIYFGIFKTCWGNWWLTCVYNFHDCWAERTCLMVLNIGFFPFYDWSHSINMFIHYIDRYPTLMPYDVFICECVYFLKLYWTKSKKIIDFHLSIHNRSHPDICLKVCSFG